MKMNENRGFQTHKKHVWSSLHQHANISSIASRSDSSLVKSTVKLMSDSEKTDPLTC
jgi:hypothetical protein